MNSQTTIISDVDSEPETSSQPLANEFIPVAAPVIGEREIAYVTDAVKSGWVSSIGEYVNRFEESFANYIGVKHAIAVSNGTAALHVALHALGIGQADEVILPDLTFAATAHTVLQVGATPVFVDVEPDTWCISPEAIERAITPKTRTIMPVHLYGHPAEMDRINALANAHGLIVIEDAAEAHGALIAKQKVGSLGTVAGFSFYGNKLITTGEGGMLTTNDDQLASRIRFLKDHGMSAKVRYLHTELAFNYRMTNLQAALGLAQLEQIETFIQMKRQIFEWYRQALDDVPGLTFNVERPGCRNIYWMISVVLDDSFELSRDALCARLKAQGIDTRPFFLPMSELPHLSSYQKVGVTNYRCPVSVRLSRRGLNLPSGCGISREQVVRVAAAIKKILQRGE